MGFAVGIGLAAFLLFAVQPFAAAALLPWFGGASSVWTTCLLFFQTLLLGGYAYAFWLGEQRGVVQRRVHAIVLLASLAALPILPDAAWAPQDGSWPLARLLLVLAVSVGPPYFVLATSGPLLQHWLAVRFPERDPYRLYALSNAASLLGLLAYPLLVQPLFDLPRQAWGWSGLYVVYVVVVLALVRGVRGGSAGAVEAGPPPDRRQVLRWLGLAATGTALLLAATNKLTQDVASVPFLWVVPLMLYLGTLIVAFDRPGWYRPGPTRVVFLVAILPLGLWATLVGWTDLLVQGPALCVVLAAGCMLCHGELVREKPEVRWLTRFYLAMSAGGALGGLFVAVAAPLVFDTFVELGLAAVAAFVLTLPRGATATPRGAVVVTLGFWYVAAGLGGTSPLAHLRSVDIHRSFYGVSIVTDAELGGETVRRLEHGQVLHGMQRLDHPRVATSYYGERSGVAQAFGRTGDGALIGVVGLGTGTLAVHARTGQRLRFYELDPDGEAVARQWFTYLEDAEAEVEVRLGDARLALEREETEHDLLVVDAFSGDAVPVHLLTEEAFGLYAERLAEGGLLAVHVSNLHLELERVAVAGAESAGLGWVLVEVAGEPPFEVTSRWMLAAEDAAVLEGLSGAAVAEPLLWTDQQSSLLPILR